MIRFLFSGRQALGCLTLLALPIGAWAQQPDPLDAEAATAALVYQSPLDDYRGFNAEPVQSWREANDRVGRIGGWQTYAQEPLTDDSPAAERAPAVNPHAGHGR